MNEPTDAEVEAAFQLVNTTWHRIRGRALIRQMLHQFVADRAPTTPSGDAGW
jgi:hypothetical protein